MNTHEQRLSIGEALGFLASVIKSGESWSSECQTILDAAKAQVLTLETQLSEEHLKGESCTLDWAEKLDAAEAKVEKLTKERDEARESILAYCAPAIHDGPNHESCGIRDIEARADAAEAKVLSLEAEIGKMKKGGGSNAEPVDAGRPPVNPGVASESGAIPGLGGEFVLDSDEACAFVDLLQRPPQVTPRLRAATAKVR